MKLQDALSKLGPIRGATSMIAGLMSGDTAPISGGKLATEARERLAAVRKAQDECKSDWAYWGYQGDISYWHTVVALLEAAEITGPDALPDVHYDDRSSVVMDMCANQERFGDAVLRAARATANPQG